ncbi:glycosyltransferase [Yinghuangia sp. ASG 101]|uniref:glycosyltransferase n=1 Tax=Yinghuangia sp. ASG 101 TaxID=2896848 RepID=UPI001E491A3E|nr:glycosyltransferase [Yinghuangia sp. ASG 101]UGQ09521.1 glycosyltransferase [Yinghuangia sp. ASG 101]
MGASDVPPPAAAMQPRLVLLRMNWITGDSRIQKLALGMAERGWDVVVLGRSRTSAREVTTLGDPERGAATVIRVPVPSVVAPYRRSRRQRGVLGRVGFATRDDEVADRVAVNFLRREQAAEEAYLDTAADRVRHTLRGAGVTAARARHMVRREAARRHAAWLARVDRPGAKARAVAHNLLSEGSGWRATQPQLVDFEAAFGPEIDALRPDIVHAQDITALGVGARAVERARRAGRASVMIYDAQEFIAGAGYPDPVQKAAYVGLERELIARVDGVVTVSDTLADMLRERHGLRDRPTIATNAPRLSRPTGATGRGVRGAAGLPDDVPVLVYSGWLAPERGVDTLAEALVSLPGAHAVVVAGDRRPYFAELEARVAALGVSDRFHFVPYVDPEEVVDHLSTATVGVIPLRHLPNHEISLITKYYEYMHAGLPIVVSDVRTMADFTRELHCGEVFPAGDAAGLADAVRRVLDDRDSYVKPYAADGFLEKHSWDRQTENIAALYERLTGLVPEPRPNATLAAQLLAESAEFVDTAPPVDAAPARPATLPDPAYADADDAENPASSAGREDVDNPDDAATPAGPREDPVARTRPAAGLTDREGLPVPAPETRTVILVGAPSGVWRGVVTALAASARAAGTDTVVLAPDPAGPGDSLRRPPQAPDAAQILLVPATRTVASGRDRRRGTDETQTRAMRTYAGFLGRDATPQFGRFPGLPSLGWRAALPEAIDAEVALTPVLDALAPATIHACDPVALLIASHAAARARKAGRTVTVEYHRPGTDPTGLPETRQAKRALRTLERACVPRARTVHAPDVAEATTDAAPTARSHTPVPPASPAASRGEPDDGGPAVTGRRRAASLFIGPANMAGQGWAWAQAAERFLPGVTTEVTALHRDGPLRFPADRQLTSQGWESAELHLALRRHVIGEATHVLLESGLPLTGRAARSGRFSGDARVLRDAGIAVGLVFHGSDVRDPRRHRELYPESPFADPNSQVSQDLQPRHDARMADVADWDGPVFVSTPDLLDFVVDRWPHAAWLPVVVDLGIWRPGDEPLGRAKPVVLHAPSRGTLKSSPTVDAVVGDLAARGLVEYRRVEGVPPDDMPALVASADIVIDQLALGNVGVLAAQAMAAGRLVVGHAAPSVRARFTGGVPQLEATPRTLRTVLTSVLDDRDAARELASAGPAFTALHHDGRRSAAALASFLATPAPGES